MEQTVCKKLYLLGFPNMTHWANHDYAVTEVNDPDKGFMGDLYKCKLCGSEHLCCQRKNIAASCTHGDEFYMNCPIAGVKYSSPSLSELIEACGDDFRLLTRDRNSDKEFNGYSACGWGDIVLERFNTPEEAVTALWIELKKI